ncbi:hypothetical protein LBMAG20_15410 [Methylocystaceae bacterium]|jgi:hypothetical protein|nr:hypothetical protein LBMAG20_15410 [Methylocystaceae bacterium]
MGEVIAFQKRKESAKNNSLPGIGEAEILFFLGVRYIRIQENGSQALDDKPRRDRKRKKRLPA